MTDRPEARPGTAPRTRVELSGVPETLLWTLYHRAMEARRSDAPIHDPKAIELVDSIDYPFAGRFGTGEQGQGQWQALRAQCFDRQIQRFLAGHPGATVVALGEGLETQFWRVDDGRVGWLSVDLPEVIELRRRLLPGSPRLASFAGSALDEVDTSRGVLVTAQGLLMYLQRSEVHQLIATCARRFPGGALLFDAVPRWFSALTLRGAMKTAEGFQAPPMPWGMGIGDLRRFRAEHPDIAEVRRVRPAPGRGLAYGRVLPLASAVPVVRDLGLSIVFARFAGAGSSPAASA